MKVPDTNILLYAANTAAPQHSISLAWLEQAFGAPAGVGLAWMSLLGFLRVSTRRGIFPNPLSVEDALRTMSFWLDQPRARVLLPTQQHADLLGELLATAGTAGNLTTDAHLAALAIEHGATLASFDRDFDRFDRLRFERLRA